MAKASKLDVCGHVHPKLKKPAYEFKLSRVCEVGISTCIDTPESAYAYWQNTVQSMGWFQENKEHLIVMLLNTRHNIEGHNLVSIGSINECIAHPREILGPVLCGGAYGFLLMHNHPSGDPSPSAADRRLTRRIKEAADLLSVEFLDHVIAGKARPDYQEPYFSFKEMGLL